MSDERVRAWALTLAQREDAVFAAARENFCAKPSSEGLHQMRTSARRLRSLYDDVGSLLPEIRRGRLKRLIKRSGDARDAAVLLTVLEGALDETERPLAASLLDDLRKRERNGLHVTRRRVKRFKAR